MRIVQAAKLSLKQTQSSIDCKIWEITTCCLPFLVYVKCIVTLLKPSTCLIYKVLNSVAAQNNNQNESILNLKEPFLYKTLLCRKGVQLREQSIKFHTCCFKQLAGSFSKYEGSQAVIIFCLRYCSFSHAVLKMI